MSGFGSSVSGSSGTVSSVAGTIRLESGARSILARRGTLSHPAIPFFLAAVILFAAYALGYIPQLGSLLEAAMRSGQSTAIPALSPAFYGIAGLVAFLLFLAALRSIEMLLGRIRKTSSLANRPEKPLAEFLQEAAAAKVSACVARESYYLLQPHYPHRMCIGLADLLRNDLGLEEGQIRVLDAKLLARCDRRDCPSETAALDLSKLVTVFDLLVRVESAARAQTERPSGIRVRSTDVSVPLPVRHPSAQRASVPEHAAQNLRSQTSRNPTSAQRKAIHAAALHAIESRSLRIATTSGLHRRSSDYEGPRRRATDDPSKVPEFQGPYRRFTDQMAARTGTSPCEPTTEFDSTEINRTGPVLVPPRTRRREEPGTGN